MTEVRLLGRKARLGGEELGALEWLTGHSPACSSCAHPTTGVEEQYARVPGQREPVIVALAQPCGSHADDHVAQLQPRTSTGEWTALW